MIKQIGGDHYGGGWQHWDWIVSLGKEAALYYLIGNATKYICRHRVKNGKQDVLKAISYIDKASEEIGAQRIVIQDLFKIVEKYDLNLLETKILFLICNGEWGHAVEELKRLSEEYPPTAQEQMKLDILGASVPNSISASYEAPEEDYINTEHANDLPESSDDPWSDFKGSAGTLAAVRASGLIPWPFDTPIQDWGHSNSCPHFFTESNGKMYWNGSHGTLAVTKSKAERESEPSCVIRLDGWVPTTGHEHFIGVRHDYVDQIIDNYSDLAGSSQATRNEGWVFTGDDDNQFIIVHDKVYGVGEGENWEKDVS